MYTCINLKLAILQKNIINKPLQVLMKLYNCLIINVLEAVTEASRSVNADLIGGVIGAVLSVLIMAAIVLLIIFLLYRRYCHTTQPSLKKAGR